MVLTLILQPLKLVAQLVIMFLREIYKGFVANESMIKNKEILSGFWPAKHSYFSWFLSKYTEHINQQQYFLKNK